MKTAIILLLLFLFTRPFICYPDQPCYPDCIKSLSKNGLFKSNGTAYALLVGINYYGFENHPGRDSLRKAISDVKSMMNVLQDNGYCVDTLLGDKATPRELRSRLSKIVHTADKCDRVLFYFAGHGITREMLEMQLRDDEEFFLLGDKNEKNFYYIILRQLEKDTIIRDVISLGEIADSLASTAALMQKVIIIDACYSGSGNPPVIAPFNANHHLLSDNGYYSLLTFSSIVKEGIYTRHIVKALEGDADVCKKGNNDGFVDVFELSRYVDNAVGVKTLAENGEVYRATSVYIGSGAINLTKRK